jgi:hypothetical protein
MFNGPYSAVAFSLMGVKEATLTSALPGNSTRLIIYKNSGVLDLDQTLRLRFPTGVRDFFPANFKTGFGALPGSYSMGTGCLYTGAKAARV